MLYPGASPEAKPKPAKRKWWEVEEVEETKEAPLLKPLSELRKLEREAIKEVPIEEPLPTLPKPIRKPALPSAREEQEAESTKWYEEEKSKIETGFAEAVAGLPPKEMIERGDEWRQYKAAEEWYTENIAALDAAMAEQKQKAAEFFEVQEAISSYAGNLQELLKKDEDIDAVSALIPEYQTALEKYRYFWEQEEEPETRTEALAMAEETLAGLADILLYPEKYMPLSAWAEKSSWEKITASFEATVLGAPLYMAPLLPITVPLGILSGFHQEKVEAVFGTIKRGEEYFAAAFMMGVETGWLAPLAAIGIGTPGGERAFRELREMPLPFTQEALERYREMDYPWGVKGVVEIAPWFMFPYGAALQGVRGIAGAPTAIRGTLGWTPETIRMMQWTKLAVEHPALRAQLPKIANLMKPVTAVTAATMEPAALAARSVLWTGGVVSKAVVGVVKATLKPITIPVRYGVRTVASALNLKALNKTAMPKGLQVSATRPTAEAPHAAYVVRGITPETKGLEVFARDMSEVKNYVVTGKLIPEDMAGLNEMIYVKELDVAMPKSLFIERIWPNARVTESRLGTVYSTAEHPSLTVISQTMIKGPKPLWVSQETWARAKNLFEAKAGEINAFHGDMHTFMLRSVEEVAAVRFNPDMYRQAGLYAAKNPQAKWVIERVNKSATADTAARQAVIVWLDDTVVMQSWKSYWVSGELASVGQSTRLFGIQLKKVVVRGERAKFPKEEVVKVLPEESVDAPFVTKVRVKPGQEGASMALGDILETIPASPLCKYLFTPEQATYITKLHEVVDEAVAFALRHDVRINKREMLEGLHYVPRTTHFGLAKGEVISYTGARVGTTPFFARIRQHETMMEGIQVGVPYGGSAEEYIGAYLDGIIRMVADKRLADTISPKGITPTQIVARQQPTLIQALRDTANKSKYLGGGRIEFTAKGVKHFHYTPGLKATVQRVRQWWKIPEGTIKAAEVRFPALGAKLRQITEIPMPVLEKTVKAISKEQWQSTKITRARFLEVLAEVRGERVAKGIIIGEKNVLPGELTATLTKLNVEARLSVKLLNQIYKQAYKIPSAEREALIKELLVDIEAQIKVTRAELNVLKRQYKTAVEIARRPIDKNYIQHPAFAGKLFDEEIVATITKAFKTETNAWLRASATVSGLLRTAVAALDMSAAFIHGLPVFGQDVANALAGKPTFVWANSVTRSFHTLLDYTIHAKYLVKNEAAIAEFVKHGGYVGGSEFYEAMSTIQNLIRTITTAGGRLPKGTATPPLWVLRQTYGRAEAAFGAFGDVARVELWRSLKPLVEPKDYAELVQTINKMTGVTSSQGLGIGASQAAIESGWVFFAPRYTRAGFALIADIFRGGIRGQLARESLGGLMAGGMAVYIGTCNALGQTPNLDPRYPTFMTVRIGNQNVGVGGFMMSFVRFQSNLMASAVTDPSDLFVFSRRDNPILKFLYNKSAQLTRLTENPIKLLAGGTAVNYFGDPLEDTGDVARYLLGFVTPIAMQSVTTQKDKANFVSLLAEIMGMRTFPKSIWDYLKEERDRLAPFAPDLTTEQIGMRNAGTLEWGHLSKGQKEVLIKTNPDLAALELESSLQSIKRGDEEKKRYGKWQESSNQIEVYRQGQWDIAITEYQHNMELKKRWREGDTTLTEEEIEKAKGAGRTFRGKISDIGTAVYNRRQQLRVDFPDVYELFDQWGAEEEESSIRNIAAYDEYVWLMYEKGGLEDESGNPLWDEIEKREQEFILEWGRPTYEWVQRELARLREEPPLVVELRAAKEHLRPYWEVEETLLASGRYPKDRGEQEEWIVRDMAKSNKYASELYAAMVRAYEEDRALYDKYRGSSYMRGLFAWADRIRIPTVGSVLGDKREEMRRADPKMDAYLVTFYDRVPIMEQ